MTVRRFSEHGSEPMEQQPENGLALASGPGELLGGVVEDGPGGAALEAAPRLVIELRGQWAPPPRQKLLVFAPELAAVDPARR